MNVLAEHRWGATGRRDAWWLPPLGTALGLGLFGIYATWAALEGQHYEWGPYLSPFYSPLIDADHTWWPFSPAFLILWAPGGFRATCYYYRKAYYRALFQDPPACAVGEPRDEYKGETAFPFIMQNLHRYFLPFALILPVFLWMDAVAACNFEGNFGIGVGTIVLMMNAFLLSVFTLSCNSLRHIMGGNVDCFSCVSFGKARFHAWNRLSGLNHYHMEWAWCSLFWVGVSDIYVRLLALGVITDFRIL